MKTVFAIFAEHFFLPHKILVMLSLWKHMLTLRPAQGDKRLPVMLTLRQAQGDKRSPVMLTLRQAQGDKRSPVMLSLSKHVVRAPFDKLRVTVFPFSFSTQTPALCFTKNWFVF